MNQEIESSFLLLQETFAQYFEAEFQDEAEDSRANESMRLKLRDLILDAAASNDKAMVRRAIQFLVRNTGCEEDFRIYRAIRLSLLAESVISEAELIELERRMPVNRWM